MSYGFDLNFVNCKDLPDAFNRALQTTEACYAHLKELLDREYVFIPSVRYCLSGDHKKANELWLTRLLEMNFVWWPEYKLLGLVGGGWPNAVLHMFTKCVYFQDSSDQNYDFDTWEGLKEPFREIVDTCEHGKLCDVASYMLFNRHSPETYAFEYYAGMEKYYRKSAAYNGIFETLHLDNWLYGKDDDAFVRFTLTPLNSQERQLDASILLETICKSGNPA